MLIKSPQRLKGPHGTKHIVGVPEVSTVVPSLVPPMPTPLPPTTSLVAEPEELAFFDRVRKHIGNKSQYSEFLKLINLFTQDLAAPPYLVFRAQSFIGNNPELLSYFRTFFRADQYDEVIDNQPKNIHGKIQLSNCRGMGPSYRLLPKLERLKKCSGRDQLCNDVLNDDWVSHPTWASEDSGFVAHRKNAHEEGLHRIEEERHDYDFYIESCERTIQLLEPIAQNLNSSTPEIRRQFRLDPKLGGQSEAIYKRVVYKIYGRESGNQVLGNLFNRPYDVVPVLLTRLKNKLSEWKAAQAQWNQVWRTQTNILFYRSLDHQGVATRVADKRQFWPKQLTNECLVRYHEQKRQRELHLPVPTTFQYTYQFNDLDVLSDVGRLLLAYVDLNHSTEYPKITSFTKEFLSLFFLDATPFEEDGRQSNGSPDDGEESSPGPDGGLSPRHKSNNKQKNLLRGVLDRPRGRASKRDNDSVASDSRGTSPENASVGDEEMGDGSDSPHQQPDDDKATSSNKWFQHPTDSNFINGEKVSPNEQYQRHIYNMYCNGNIYCFIRVFSILYERLIKLKDNEDEVHKIVKRAKHTKAASDLGWIEKPVSHFFSDSDANANYYLQMLDLFHSLIKSETEMNHVEDTLRRFYLQDGWQLYSLDKLLAALARFAILMMTNDAREKSLDIYQLFKKDRLRGDVTSNQEELNYRKQAEKIIKDDVFRIVYVSP
jgi:paired amphipathic helix protein Sin3a